MIDVEAWAWGRVSDLGGMKVWLVDSASEWPFRVERSVLQVDVRASSKKSAFDRAVTARDRLVREADDHYPSGGVIAATRMVSGPAWLPDDSGGPRYVLRVEVDSHPVDAG